MRVHFGLEQLAAEWDAAVGCVGTFDGVHLGHQAVIGQAVARAREHRLPCVLATFDRHPLATLAPDRCPPTLATIGANLGCFERLGVDVALVLPFDRAMSEMPATRFLEDVLQGALRVDRMVVGHDFAFGHGREGTSAWLAPRLPTETVPPMLVDGERASSSAIRAAIAEGSVEAAGRMLGRPYALEGVVVAGEQLGRRLGYPTLNLARSSNQVVPAHGVYAGSCGTPLGEYRAAVSIGVRPAVGGTRRTIEAYLLDYPGESLYGRPVELAVSRRLRGEQDFASLEALVEQIARDVENVATGG
ncbi:MAG: riboflavin biosynthesis protein RibF [Fimbriimonadaceae bacterium]|nr:riboflavin biosynthesis protein RibF [Fimbriimonadaceae bacterium]